MSFILNPKQPAKRTQPLHVNPIEQLEDFTKLKSAIVNGRFTPLMMAEIHVRGKEYAELGIKDPARTFAARLKKLLRTLKLDSDYSVVVIKATDLGWPVIRVTYEPPMTQASSRKQLRSVD